jgi:hypothetical protein
MVLWWNILGTHKLQQNYRTIQPFVLSTIPGRSCVLTVKNVVVDCLKLFFSYHGKHSVPFLQRMVINIKCLSHYFGILNLLNTEI